MAIAVLPFTVSGVCVFRARHFSLREKRNPFAVRRPLRRRTVRGLGQLYQASGGLCLGSVVRRPVKPEFFAEDLLLPVGPLGFNDHGIPIRRHFDTREADGVEKIVEGERRLCALCLGKDWLGRREN